MVCFRKVWKKSENEWCALEMFDCIIRPAFCAVILAKVTATLRTHQNTYRSEHLPIMKKRLPSEHEQQQRFIKTSEVLVAIDAAVLQYSCAKSAKPAINFLPWLQT